MHMRYQLLASHEHEYRCALRAPFPRAIQAVDLVIRMEIALRRTSGELVTCNFRHSTEHHLVTFGLGQFLVYNK
jgi:hypothetical protein